ncbi:MAG: hypothetical protein KJ623_00815 [Nanoarchaeota archaeon]|nr:hypothetical protein [Nanoarchaeota archaeon]MBU0963052.1 hypothetical protein [Nanoarchaeota archaeon]
MEKAEAVGLLEKLKKEIEPFKAGLEITINEEEAIIIFGWDHNSILEIFMDRNVPEKYSVQSLSLYPTDELDKGSNAKLPYSHSQNLTMQETLKICKDFIKKYKSPENYE